MAQEGAVENTDTWRSGNKQDSLHLEGTIYMQDDLTIMSNYSLHMNRTNSNYFAGSIGHMMGPAAMGDRTSAGRQGKEKRVLRSVGLSTAEQSLDYFGHEITIEDNAGLSMQATYDMILQNATLTASTGLETAATMHNALSSDRGEQ